MLKLSVNGKSRELEDSCSLSDALSRLGFHGRQFAVAVNGAFVPKHRHPQLRLEGGEALEILTPMQGG